MGRVTYRKAVRKGMKRTMAVSLSAMMAGGMFIAQPSQLKVVKAGVESIVEDFESETRLGGKFGNPSYELSDVAFEGTHSLKVTRKKDYESYSYNLNQFAGKKLHINAHLRVDGATNTTLVVACVKILKAGESKEAYDWVANKPAVNGDYVELDGDYEIPAGATADLYFCTYDTNPELNDGNGAGTTDDYYLDNVSIVVTGDAAGSGEVVAQTPEIKENFDELTDIADIKGSYMGEPNFALVENGEGKALAVTNRTNNYFGYAYNLAKFAGNKISVKANIAATEVITTNPDTEEKTTTPIAADASSTFAATLKTTLASEDDYQGVASALATGSAVVQLIGEYDVPAGQDNYTLYFEGPANVNFMLDDIEVTVVGEYKDPNANAEYVDTSEYEILKDLYKDYFKMGMACETISNFDNPLSEIGNKVKEDFIKKEFNSITFGNELKPAYNMGVKSADKTQTNLPFVINPSAKEMLDWAKANGVPVRGHTLVWHSQCADEFFCKDYTPVYKDPNAQNKVLDPSCYESREVLLQRMQSYIDSAMEYMYKNGYAKTIYAWDVVNEAVEPGSTPENLRNSYWYQAIGDDFIYYAFKYTREAENKYAEQYAADYDVDVNDPASLKTITPSLFYNDYNEDQEAKCTAIIDMLKADHDGHSIIGDGLIDGVGMQGHLSDNTNVDNYIKAMKRYDEVVDEVQVTELDVNQTTTGANAEYYQAQFYNKLFKAMVQAKKDGVNLTAVTIWGLTDDNSWKKETKPLIFNKDLSTKLSFDGIVGAITGEELPEPEFIAPDFSDMNTDFEPVEDAEVTLDSVGFGPRGDGNLQIQSEVVHGGESALLDTGRTASWNGASFDVSRFSGQTIEIDAWVKSKSPKVKLSADINGVWPNLAAVDTSDGEWKQIKAVYKLPAGTAPKLYFETEDIEDIYIDDVCVRLRGMTEGFEEDSNIASGRGVGHVPSFAGVTDAESHNSNGHSFLVKRAEQDASMKFDVSKYIGYTVTVKAFVKTADQEIRMGLDGAEPVELTKVASNGEWTEVSATLPISSDLTSAQMYVETEGNADLYVDDISIAIADFTEDCESETPVFKTRWGGAGTLTYVEDGAAGNHAACLTGRTDNYLGIAFDATAYAGMEIELSVDVKTDDANIKVSGDNINGAYPNYIDTTADPGNYKTVKQVIKLPNVSSIQLYVETDGTSDLYVDNLKIKKVIKYSALDFDMGGHGKAVSTQAVVPGELAVAVEAPTEEGFTFGGWYKDAACTTAWDFEKDVVSADTTVYAKWTKDGEATDPTPTDPTPTDPTPSNPTPSTPVVTPTQPAGTTAPGIYDNATSFKTVYSADTKDANVVNSTLRQALTAGKTASYEFNGSDGKLAYSFSFKPEAYNTGIVLRNMKLGLTVAPAKDLNHEEGLLVSLQETGKLAMETTLKLNVSNNFKAGDTLYLYKVNDANKKLFCLPNNTYAVDKDGYVELNVISGDDYVLLPAAASAKEKVGFMSQVGRKGKVEIKARQTMDNLFVLPEYMQVVSSLDDFDATKATLGAVVTYKTSNKKIATINKDGRVWAVKKGKCRVAVTITLSNGTTKKFATTVVVK